MEHVNSNCCLESGLSFCSVCSLWILHIFEDIAEISFSKCLILPKGASDFFEEKEDDVENSDDEEEIDGNVEFKMEAPKSDDSDDLISDDENEKPKKKRRKEEEKEVVEKESDKRQREELELLFSRSVLEFIL